MGLISRKIIFLISLFLLIFLLLYLSFRGTQKIELSALLSIREKVRQFPILSPLLFFLSQILQILFPIIPGNVLNFAGGYIFGVGMGSLFSILGVLSGSLIAFLLSRHLGRKVLRFFIRGERLKRFDQKIKEFGPFLFFLLFLIPNPLGDLLYYLYGLTDLPFSFFLPAVLIARSPGIIFSSYLGAKALSFTVWEWLVFGCLLFLLVALFYLFQDKILFLIYRKVANQK
ncbi:MAG: VTT domain-containing protein [candidate division WOR-3 bacterium]